MIPKAWQKAAWFGRSSHDKQTIFKQTTFINRLQNYIVFYALNIATTMIGMTKFTYLKSLQGFFFVCFVPSKKWACLI
jgi:hypothetical protein